MDNDLSYLDYAEIDYRFFTRSYDAGIIESPMAALGQNACEKYLKHIINEYSEPETDSDILKKERVLKTHNLNKLMSYISDEMNIDIPENAENYMSMIDGFYFSTRYPGEDNFVASMRDIRKAKNAIEATREFTLEVCNELNSEQEYEEEYDGR